MGNVFSNFILYMFPVLKSQIFVNCHINCFILSALVNEFNSKEMFKITFDKIKITLQPVKVAISSIYCSF